MVKQKVPVFILILAGLNAAILSPAARAAEEPSRDFYKSKPLDGVTIEAVEDYLTPKTSQLDFAMGVFPFNSYYLGLSLNAGYVYNFSPNFSWEVVHAAYVFDYQKGLTTELADKYSVQPQTIETLTYIISTNILYVFSYGKFVLLKDYIRYFRTSALFGLGLVGKSLSTGFGVDLGVKIEVFTSETFAWKLEVRNTTVVNNFDNNTSFTLGPSIQF